ncbi:MAG: YceI family protein [Chitinophagaceae bacterium]|jgi:polyisoprenoid-binding protein YceI|nr:YceI family protein [Chitinophagaceae bacterium]
MKKLIVLLSFVVAGTASAFSQSYLTKNGKISFHSSTPIEDINATNNEVVSTLNATTGKFDFRVAILGFKFKSVDMQKHFNGDTYMNSAKYPKASFTGTISNISAVDFSKDGTYNVTVAGNLTIKDVTKPLTTSGTITVKGGKVTAKAEFKVKRSEFNVSGEAIHEKKIAQTITVKVDCTYDKK